MASFSSTRVLGSRSALNGQAIRSATRTNGAGRQGVRVMASNRVDKCLKSDVIVSPSILSANFAKLGEQVGTGFSFELVLVKATSCRGQQVQPQDGSFTTRREASCKVGLSPAVLCMQQ